MWIFLVQRPSAMLLIFDALLAADASAMYQTLLFSLFFAKRKTGGLSFGRRLLYSFLIHTPFHFFCRFPHFQARHPYTNIFRSQSFLLSRSQSSLNLFRKDSKHFFLNLIISKQQRKEILVLIQAIKHGVFFGGCYPICNERCTRLLRQGFRHRYSYPCHMLSGSKNVASPSSLVVIYTSSKSIAKGQDAGFEAGRV